MKAVMNNFVEVRFPEDISYGSTGGPCFSTDLVETSNNIEYRNINWSEGRLKYNISYGVRTQQQLMQLINFFRARRGRAIGFRFKDWTDYSVANQLIAISDGESKRYQLFKTYHSGEQFELRKIFKPVRNTVKLYTEKSILNFTIDYTTGIIELEKATSIKEKIFADFEFDVPVRFDSDDLTYSIDNFRTNSCPNIFIIEIKN